MMPTDYPQGITAEERVQLDRDNAHGVRIILFTPVLIWSLIVALVALVIALSAAASSASADPNVETVLPAHGVTSIERVGDTWTVATIAAPSEIKTMTPNIGPVCGVNYADSLGLCSTTTTFTASTGCVYIQVDGIPGEDSSDPYVCRTTPTTSPNPEETPWPSTTPTPTPVSAPEPTSKPVPTSVATPADVTPSPSSTAAEPEPVAPVATSLPTLANTGTSVPLIPGLIGFALCLAGVLVGSRFGARIFRLSDDSE
jgi:hypothetical protein